MKYLTDNLRRVLLLLALLIASYLLFRILFLSFNYSIFQDMEGKDMVRALFYGLRYDISAILYTNVVFFLMLLLPFKFILSDSYQKTIRTLFIAVNLLAFTIAFMDFAYFQFNLKRIDVEIFGLLGTFDTLIWDFIKDFYLVFMLFFLSIWGFIKLVKEVFKVPPKNQFHLRSALLIFIIFLPVFVIGMRGGITNKRPLRIVDSCQYLPVKYSPLVTNSVFTFINSLAGRILQKRDYFSQSDLGNIYEVRKTQDGVGTGQKKNVVILVLESFSKEFTSLNENERSYTPFLDELMDSSLVCSNAYASGRRSSQGLVAISSSIPALMDEPFMYSKYVNNNIYGLGSILKEYGYETFFFNGSDKDKVGWQSYLMSAGFEHNLDKFDYPNQAHDDGSWGIYDHYFYDFFIDEMSKVKGPFGSIFFSISSHHPFKIPPEFQERFSGSGDFFNSLEYADYALRLFFEKASKTDWFKNTIFIITADHTYGANWNDGNSTSDKFKTRKGLYEIPILFYCPGKDELIGEVDFPVQQTDIMPSLIDLLDLKSNYLAFGQSIFSKSDQPRIAYQYLNGIYQVVNEEYILMHDGDKAIGLYNVKQDPLLEENIMELNPEVVLKLERLLKAIIQQHNNRLVDNDLINGKE